MRTAVQLTADAAPWPDLVDYVVEAERMGVDMVWVAEAWGSDAASPLGYLAARTERILLGSGVFQLGVRSAAMTAQTALTLAAMSGNRFALGLGTSGPQVMEGLHGVSFTHPLGRMRETLDVIRLAFAGERITADGSTSASRCPTARARRCGCRSWATTRSRSISPRSPPSCSSSPVSRPTGGWARASSPRPPTCTSSIYGVAPIGPPDRSPSSTPARAPRSRSPATRWSWQR